MSNKSSTETSPALDQPLKKERRVSEDERKRQLSQVRMAGRIYIATELGGLLLMGALTLVLGITSWKLMNQGPVWAGQQKSTDDPLPAPAITNDSPGNSPNRQTPSVKSSINPDSLGQLDQAVKDLKEVIDESRADMDKDAKLPPLKRLLECWREKSEKAKEDSRLADYAKKLNEAELKINKAETEKDELAKAKEQLKSNLEKSEREADDLKQKLTEEKQKLTVETLRLNELRGKIPAHRNPDPSLATLVIVIDAQTPLNFLSGELMKLYAYHNIRKTDGEIVLIDLAQGGKLKQIPTSSRLRTEAELRGNFEAYAKGLEGMEQGQLPLLEEVPRKLPPLFRVVPPDEKRIQIVLVAGGECSAPSGNSWDNVKKPVHVFIINDGRALAPDYKDKWEEFTRRNSGDFESLEVDFQNQSSMILAETRFKLWLEDRLCFTSTSVR